MEYILSSNGFKNKLEATTSKKARDEADDSACYTQEPMYILDNDGNCLYCRSWINHANWDNEGKVIDFGNFGYYSAWEVI